MDDNDAYDYKFVKWMIKEKVEEDVLLLSNITGYVKPFYFFHPLNDSFDLETGSNPGHGLRWG